MDSRKISICIPTYNRYEMTIKAFMSVLGDDRISEVILVDDCSTNGDGNRLLQLFQGNHKVRVYINEKNLDCYANKHRSVELATNQWCVLFDSDNLLTSQYIDTLYNIPDWDIYTIYQPIFARPHFDFRPHANITLTAQNVNNYMKTNVETSLNAMNFFINRDQYLRVWDGSIDPVTSDSIYFSYCWLKAGNSIYMTPGLEYDHLVHKGHYQENYTRTGNFHKELLSKFPALTNITTINKMQEQVTDTPQTDINQLTINGVDVYAAYCNLEKRPDRNEHMQKELQRVEITAERFNSYLPEDVIDKMQPMNKLEVMYKRTKGAIGCHYSQVGIMEKALEKGQHAWVMEDDLVYCDDIQDRLKTIIEYLNTHEWDIFWFGGTWHSEPTWHKSVGGHHTHPDLKMCTCNLNRDWEPTDHPNIVRTYGAFSTHSYIVNYKSLPKILDLLDQNVYRSMGIDWIMLLIQPELHAYAFTPGCCKQFDNQSNIGNGISRFSGFVNLGPHWYKQTL